MLKFMGGDGVIDLSDRVFGVDAACVMSEVKWTKVNGEDGVALSDANGEYKYAMLHDSWLLASKDCANWVIAVYVCIDGNEYSRKEIEECFEKVKNFTMEEESEKNG